MPAQPDPSTTDHHLQTISARLETLSAKIDTASAVYTSMSLLIQQRIDRLSEQVTDALDIASRDGDGT